MSGLCDTCKIKSRCISPEGGLLACPLYEQDRKSRWFELFGTPEMAAMTMARQCFGATSEECNMCVFGECDGKLRNSGAYQTVYDTLLEWLRGDA